eukprot:759709-Hanusia_phi.AAC.1
MEASGGKRRREDQELQGSPSIAHVLGDWVRIERTSSESVIPRPNHFLSLEEAFYRAFILGNMRIRAASEDRIMELSEAWSLFSERNAEFQRNFVVYHHYCQRGWKLIQGTKYGCNFLLYPREDGDNSVRHKHAPYAVQILPDGIDGMTWLEVSKELILASVEAVGAGEDGERPRSILSYEDACKMRVSEMKIARWEPERDR